MLPLGRNPQLSAYPRSSKNPYTHARGLEVINSDMVEPRHMNDLKETTAVFEHGLISNMHICQHLSKKYIASRFNPFNEKDYLTKSRKMQDPDLPDKTQRYDHDSNESSGRVHSKCTPYIITEDKLLSCIFFYHLII